VDDFPTAPTWVNILKLSLCALIKKKTENDLMKDKRKVFVS
jgi:hypothetical protein